MLDWVCYGHQCILIVLLNINKMKWAYFNHMNYLKSVSATPPASQLYSSYSQGSNGSNGLGLTQSSAQSSGLSKYAQLLAVIEEMGRDIRPTYAMGRGDRLKRLIIQAKVNIFASLS